MPVITPQIGAGARLNLEISEEDCALVQALPRVKGTELRITALDGLRYLLVRWDCTLPHCCCDMLAYGIEDPE